MPKRVNLTVINAYKSGNTNYAYLYTYTNIQPYGDWYLKGSNFNSTPIGRVRLTFLNKPVNFGYGSIAFTNSNISSSSVLFPPSSYLLSLYRLDDNKVNIFALVKNAAKDSAYCGWIVNQNLDADTLYLSLNFNKFMRPYSITTNRPITRGQIVSFRGSLNFSYVQDIANFSTATTQPALFYNSSFPCSKVQFYCSGENFTYSYTDQSLPHSFSIPNTSITAIYSYGSSQRRYQNIEVENGTHDLIYGSWGYSTSSKYHYWYVYSKENSEIIDFPSLPSEIISEINIMPDSLTTTSLWLNKYDSFHGYDDYINKTFKSESYEILYKESYRAYFYPSGFKAVKESDSNHEINDEIHY